MSDNDWRVAKEAEAANRMDAQALRHRAKQQQKQAEHRPRNTDVRPTPIGKRRRNTPPIDVIRLISHEDDIFLKARLDDGYPRFFGGYGGWEDEARPGQVAATIFRGTTAPRMKLRLILGGWPTQPRGTDCERDMRRLDHFARIPFDGGAKDRPTLLRIRGQVPHHHRRWFVENLEWGDVLVHRSLRVRAFVTVTLRMYVPVELLKRRDRVARPTRGHTVRRGEDLQQIVKENMDVDATGEIVAAAKFVRRINGLKPGVALTANQRLKLPVGSWWRRESKKRAPIAATGTPKIRPPKVLPRGSSR
ncbi:MAG TPA: hypothetical protein VLK58_26425 [Conexibacter sp.]|nr:hypothetical protein [Conexibacter sp.]